MTLQIVGAGFGRTGTMSLKLALEQLTLGACYHMTEIAAHPEHARLWLADARGERIDFGQILAGYTAAIDWPACTLWRELLAAYPNARVILTVRDAAQWYESFSKTIMPRIENLAPLADPGVGALYDVGREVILRRTFEGRAGDARHAIAVFEAHNAEVIGALGPERLLVYEISEGWPPLCRFLGVPVPTGPFPHANAHERFPTLLRSRASLGPRRVMPTR